MSSSAPIVRRFERAGLPLELAPGPLVARSEIVQLDIARRPREHFLLWKGAAGNRVEAEGVDRELRQLVLFVHEPVRTFELEVGPFANLSPADRVIRRDGRRRWIQRATEDRKRHFLCGMDEQHLFIAELPRAVTTVRDAHQALRAPELSPRVLEETIRQGEWFFTPLSADQEVLLEKLARRFVIRRNIGIAQVGRINRRGRQHIAEEAVCAEWPTAPSASEMRIFVRGSVRHPDHRTLTLTHWHRVVGNAEPAREAIAPTWFD